MFVVLRKLGPVIMILSGLAMAAGGSLLLATPTGCYRSAINELQVGRWAANGFSTINNCDPLATISAPAPTEAFHVSTSVNAYAGPAGFNALIRPDGSGEVFEFLPNQRVYRFTGQQDSYRTIARQIAPLLEFSGTPPQEGDPRRLMNLPTLYCGAEPPGYHSGLNIIGTEAGEIDLEEARSFTLECEGPAGDSLRARAEVVETELVKLAQFVGLLDPNR